MGIVAGDKIEAKDIYGRAGFVGISAGSGKVGKVTLNTSGAYMIVFKMSTSTTCGGILMIHYISGWKTQWIFNVNSLTNQLTIGISGNVLTITNKNTGVQVFALIFGTTPWTFDSANSSNSNRTDIAAARPGDIIYARDLNNTRHSRNIQNGTSYTIALANYAETPKFFFTRQGTAANNNYSLGVIWHTSSGWFYWIMKSAGTVPTMAISGTNLTITAPSVYARVSWFEVL